MSAYAARVRVCIRAKNLPIRIINNSDVTSVPFGNLNPLRRVPVLVLDDGSSIPESETIVEYLEEVYPHTPLRPIDPVARARVRLIARVAEQYVFPAALPIFGALAAPDAPQTEALFDKLDGALRNLESFLNQDSQSWHTFGANFSTADAALAPFLFYIEFLGTACGRTPLASHHKLTRFWQRAQTDPILSPVLDEISTAWSAARSRPGAKS
jgi:maleylpyruvate isomerase